MPNAKQIATDIDLSQKHLFLIDGYGFVFRAYHSLPPLTAPDGTPVGAVYGFTNMLMKLKARISAENGHSMLVVLDSGSKTFRNEIYSEYKANRPPAPEDLRPQFPIIPEAVEAMGLPTSSLKGYEADDIIATYTKIAKEQGLKVTIVSSDKDLMQLIDEDVEMYDSMKDKRVSIEQVQEKFGVEPEKVLDVLSLMGDSSDNVPGVPGIGPKTAAELINRFGTLEETLERASEVKQNKRRESLIEFADQAKLSKELVSLCYDVPVDPDLTKFALKNDAPEDLVAFLHKYGFKSLANRLEKKNGLVITETSNVNSASGGGAVNTPNAPRKRVLAEKVHTEIRSENDLTDWLKDVKSSGKLAIHLIKDKADIKGLGLCKNDNICAYIEFGEKKEVQTNLFGDVVDAGANDVLSLEQVSCILEPYLTDVEILKIASDVKALSHILRQKITPIDDIMVMSYVLDGSKHKHDLTNLAQMHLGADPSSSSDPFAQVDEVFGLNKFFRQRLFDEKMLTIYETIERPLVTILANMEAQGIKADIEVLKGLSGVFEEKISSLEKEIYALSGEEFNIASPKQLGEILFVNLGIEGGKKSKKTGAYKTGSEILEDLSVKGHVIADKILKFRELSKLKSTYSDALVKQINPKTSRIHSTFNMTATSTGRLSSNNPNLQNIPVRSEAGNKIREAFVAAKGNKLISADYSQIELRLLAHMADIEPLKEAFRKDVDVHSLTASQVFGVPLDAVDGDMRRNAKAINFGIIYGQSAFGLAKGLGISNGEAKQYIEAYFEQYPGIRKFMEQTKEEAREFEYIKTLYGRKCFTPDINSKNHMAKNFAERAAINAPLQGTAADIIKIAMIKVEDALRKSGLNAKIILQVHDELIVECSEGDAEAAAKLLKKEMQNAAHLSIPLTVDANIGDNWAEIH